MNLIVTIEHVVTYVYNDADVFFRHDSEIKEVTLVEGLPERECDMQLRLRFTTSDKSNRVDGLAIACRRCRHDERLRFSFSVDGRRHRTTVCC